MPATAGRMASYCGNSSHSVLIHGLIWAKNRCLLLGILSNSHTHTENFVIMYSASEYHTEPTVSTVRPVQSMRTVTPKPRLFLLCWHRRDVDPSNAEDDMKPPRSSPAFINQATDRRSRTSGQIRSARTVSYGHLLRSLRWAWPYEIFAH